MKDKLLQVNFIIRALIFLLCFRFFTGYSQFPEWDNATGYLKLRGEVYFCFVTKNLNKEDISKIISIDRISNDTVFAYANKQQFNRFSEENIKYNVLPPPSLLLDKSELVTGNMTDDWDVYPTYDAYVSMMNDFASTYPDICELYEIGTTVNGRKLLAVKISDNVQLKETEPEFFFSSTIHGDEVTGFILMLRLIDYLLSNYETMPEIQQLIDNIEIWINPNANPDGTYFSGNHTVSGATRYNANSADLNRNFPDPEDGDHPDSRLWQPETEAMMQFMTEHNFVFSANYHGGSEVMNYPWDTWSRSHPDEDWFEYVSHQYADTVKKYGGSSYFSNVSPDGVTNGYDWYTIYGGRQDYTTYFCNGREITIEVSTIKMPPAASLPSYWEYNRVAMLDYIGQCLSGIHGIVTNSLTGEPLVAKLNILNHDFDSSQVYSDGTNGDYHRLIAPGTYNIKCTAPGYISKVVESVTVGNQTSYVILNFELTPGINPINPFPEVRDNIPKIWFGPDLQLYMVLQHPQKIQLYLHCPQGIVISEKTCEVSAGQNIISFDDLFLAHGIYYCKIIFENQVSVTLPVRH